MFFMDFVCRRLQQKDFLYVIKHRNNVELKLCYGVNYLFHLVEVYQQTRNSVDFFLNLRLCIR
jgi:hypothetical protein